MRASTATPWSSPLSATGCQVTPPSTVTYTGEPVPVRHAIEAVAGLTSSPPGTGPLRRCQVDPPSTDTASSQPARPRWHTAHSEPSAAAPRLASPEPAHGSPNGTQCTPRSSVRNHATEPPSIG